MEAASENASGGTQAVDDPDAGAVAHADAAGQVSSDCQVFVGALPVAENLSEKLRGYFAAFGEVISVEARAANASDGAEGSYTITFASPAAAQAACRDRWSHSLDGSWIDVRPVVDSDPPGAGTLAAEGSAAAGGVGVGTSGAGGSVIACGTASTANGVSGGSSASSVPTETPAGTTSHATQDGNATPQAPAGGSTQTSAARPSGVKGGLGTRIFVGALPKGCTADEIQDHFAQFGKVVEVDLKKDAEGHNKGFAFVVFETQASAQHVLANYHDNHFKGKWVDCQLANRETAKMLGAAAIGGSVNNPMVVAAMGMGGRGSMAGMAGMPGLGGMCGMSGMWNPAMMGMGGMAAMNPMANMAAVMGNMSSMDGAAFQHGMMKAMSGMNGAEGTGGMAGMAGVAGTGGMGGMGMGMGMGMGVGMADMNAMAGMAGMGAMAAMGGLGTMGAVPGMVAMNNAGAMGGMVGMGGLGVMGGCSGMGTGAMAAMTGMGAMPGFGGMGGMAAVGGMAGVVGMSGTGYGAAAPAGNTSEAVRSSPY